MDNGNDIKGSKKANRCCACFRNGGQCKRVSVEGDFFCEKHLSVSAKIAAAHKACVEADTEA